MVSLYNIFHSLSGACGFCRNALAMNEIERRLDDTRRYLMWLPVFSLLYVLSALVLTQFVHLPYTAEAVFAVFALAVVHTGVAYLKEMTKNEIESEVDEGAKAEIKSIWLSPWVTYGVAFGVYLVMLAAYSIAHNFMGGSWWLVPAVVSFTYLVLRILLFDFLANSKSMSEPLVQRESLVRKLYEVADKAGFPAVEIHVLEESFVTPNRLVFVAPVRKTARVHFAPSVLEKFSDEELAVFFAHELGHLVPWQFPATGILMVVFSLMKWFSIGLVLSLMPAVYMNQFMFLAAILVLAMLVDAFSPVFAGYINRSMEKKADLYALKLTNDPDSFVSAFNGILDLVPTYDQNCLVAKMYATHPTIERRVTYASRWKEKNIIQTRNLK